MANDQPINAGKYNYARLNDHRQNSIVTIDLCSPKGSLDTLDHILRRDRNITSSNLNASGNILCQTWPLVNANKEHFRILKKSNSIALLDCSHQYPDVKKVVSKKGWTNTSIKTGDDLQNPGLPPINLGAIFLIKSDKDTSKSVDIIPERALARNRKERSNYFLPSIEISHGKESIVANRSVHDSVDSGNYSDLDIPMNMPTLSKEKHICLNAPSMNATSKRTKQKTKVLKPIMNTQQHLGSSSRSTDTDNDTSFGKKRVTSKSRRLKKYSSNLTNCSVSSGDCSKTSEDTEETFGKSESIDKCLMWIKTLPKKFSGLNNILPTIEYDEF